MLKSWTNTVASEDLYTVTIGDITCPTKLTEAEAKQVMSIVNGIINSRTNEVTSNAPAPAPKAEKAQAFPKLKLIEAIGFLSVYEGMAVRQWSETGFTPDKVKYGLKKAIQEAGATWDNDKKAYVFAKKTEYNAFLKAQREREKMNRKAV